MANIPVNDDDYEDDGEPLDVDVNVDWTEVGEPEEDLNDQDLKLFLNGEQKSKFDQNREGLSSREIGFENDGKKYV